MANLKELLQQVSEIVLKEKKMTDFINDECIHELCGDFAAMIIKSALAKDSFDNVSCIVIALNLNAKKAFTFLNEEKLIKLSLTQIRNIYHKIRETIYNFTNFIFI